MRFGFSCVLAGSLLLTLSVPRASLAQSALPRFGAEAKASTLGIGIEGATAVTHRSNLRFGFNVFDYHKTIDKDGIEYDATLNLRSLQLMYDQYIAGGFHVSPGLLVYNGNKVDATASVAPGGSFSLGGKPYYSNQSNPIRGSGNLKLGKAAPMILLGVGNPLPRSGRHFTVNFDAGVVFQGSPKTTLNLTGTACTISPSAGCLNAGADSTIQSNVRAEQEKLNDDLKPFKYYPVLSLGFGWRF